MPTRTRAKGISQEADDVFDLVFDEIDPEIPEADIVDVQGKPLHSSSEADMLMNAEVIISQGGDLRLHKAIIRNVYSND